MNPPYYFVRDKGSRVAHHWDYERDRRSRALCGHEYAQEIIFEGYKQPSRVCRACQDVLPRFEAKWWRQTAQKAANCCAELEQRCATAERELKHSRSQIERLTYQLGHSEGRIEALQVKVANQRKNLHDLQSARAAANRATKAVRNRSDHTRQSDTSLMRPGVPAKGTTSRTSSRVTLIGGKATGESSRH